MLEKKITFDSFIRMVLSMAIIVRHTDVGRAAERRTAAVLHCLAHCLPALSTG